MPHRRWRGNRRPATIAAMRYPPPTAEERARRRRVAKLHERREFAMYKALLWLKEAAWTIAFLAGGTLLLVFWHAIYSIPQMIVAWLFN